MREKFNRIKQVPCLLLCAIEAGDLLVSGVVQATPDKLQSSYSVMSKQRSGLRISVLTHLYTLAESEQTIDVKSVANLLDEIEAVYPL